MSAEPPSKTEASPAAADIARVAARLFASRGFDATSVREIVEGAGVAKPTLYYYFQSKEGLARRCERALVRPRGATSPDR